MNVLHLYISTLSCNRNCEPVQSIPVYREVRPNTGKLPPRVVGCLRSLSQGPLLSTAGTPQALPAAPRARAFLTQVESTALSSLRGA